MMIPLLLLTAVLLVWGTTPPSTFAFTATPTYSATSFSSSIKSSLASATSTCYSTCDKRRRWHMPKTHWRIQRHTNIYLQSIATPGASSIVNDDDDGNGIELQSNKMKRMKCMGQPNNNKGFLWIISYWTIGIFVGLLYGYIPSWPTGAVFTSYAHIVALTTTTILIAIYELWMST